MTCPDCGTQNYAADLYCKRCGADLNRKPACGQAAEGRKSLLALLLKALR